MIICPDEELATKLQTAALAMPELSIGRVLNGYPSRTDVIRTLRAHSPEVVFLSFEQPDLAQEVVKFLKAEAEGIQVVAIGRQTDQKLLQATMRAGVREFLTYPFERRPLLEALAAVKELVERKPATPGSTSQIFAFLPSKAGVGTSTIALNVSAAMARQPDTRVLLSDFDVNSGMLRFMLKLTNEYSVTDAVENSGRMDEHLWPQMVTALGKLDVLPAGRIDPSQRFETSQVRALIDFMRSNYQVVCFDLSGNLERYSTEIMQDCKRILLVCTPEIASLHLAREKLSYLKTFDLESRVSVVLNRTHKRAVFTPAQVEQILGLPVVKSFANDYRGAGTAMSNGSMIEPATDLGKSFHQFALDLLGRNSMVRAAEGKRSFLEFMTGPQRAAHPIRA